VKLGIELPFTAGVGSTWYKRFVMPTERVRLADRLGYDMVFVAETGQDCFGPLGYILAITDRIGVGTRLMQVGARSAVAAAIAFQTLDAMAGPDRTVIAGIGSSSAVRHEGWHGQAWRSPYWRMRDYVAVMRKVFKGGVLEHQGRAITVPYQGPDSTRMAPTTVLSEPNPDLPIYCGSNTPTMITLTAEIADGWLAYGLAPGMMGAFTPLLEEGFARSAQPKSLENFEIWAHIDVILSDDIKAAFTPFKEYVARLHRNTDQMRWRGYGDVQTRIQELWDAGRYDQATQAVPDEYVDEAMLVGPLPRLVERAGRWLESGATGLVLRSENDTVYEPLYRALRG
jgi:alkanesulfonate monooxygenase SsuD/methylene tetrahydromethanopterin reductase-like flavin-dependent oxidoreductase (luciferase family)